MDRINIREMMGDERMTAREINIAKGNPLIAKNPNAGVEAMRRLQTIHDVKERLQYEINSIGTQDMPRDTLESYEALWIMLQDLEQAEAKTALSA